MTESETTKKLNIIAGNLSAIAGIDKVNASLKQAQTEATKAGSALAQATKSNQLYELSKSADVSRVALGKMRAELLKIGATDDEIKKVALSIHRNYRNAVQEATEETKKLRRAAEDVKFGKNQIGDISTFSGSLGSVFSAGGSNAASELAGFAGDVTGSIEYLNLFKESVLSAGKAAAEGGGLVGNLAKGLQAAIPGLGAGAAGLGAIAAAAAPFVAVSASVVIALNNITEANRKMSESIAADNRARAEVQRSIAGGLTTDQARERVEELKRLLAAEQQILKENQEAEARARKAAEDQFGSFLGKVLYSRVQVSEEAEESVSQAITQASQAIKDYGAEIGQLETALGAGSTAIGDNLEATKKAKDEIGKLNTELDKSRQTAAALAQQQRDLNQAYLEAGFAISARRSVEDNRAREDRNKQATRDAILLNEQLEQQATQHANEMLAISKRADDAILAARQALTDKEAESVKQIAALQAQFRDDSAKAEAAYYLQRKRDTESYHRDRRRAEAAFEQSTLENLINNDIGSIVLDQRSFDLERKNARQDRRVSRRSGREDYELEKAEAEKAFQDKVKAINDELAEYTAATNAKIAQIEQQTTVDLANAATAFEQKQALDAAARERTNKWAQKDLELATARRAADRIQEDAQRLAAHQKALAQIQEKATAESLLIDGLIAKINQANSLLNSGTIIGGGNYTGAGGSQINTPPITSPVGPSTVKPFSPQFAGRNNPGGRGGGDQNGGATVVNVHIGAVGEVVTPSQLDAVVTMVVGATVAGIHRARNQRAG